MSCITGRAPSSQMKNGISNAAPQPKVKAATDSPWILGRFSVSTEYSAKITSATMKIRSPLLNSIFFDSVVRSPCSRITSTPASDSSTPQSCASVSRVPSRISDHSATTSGADWQKQRVERLGVLERPVLQRVEGADAGERQQHHDAEIVADHGPVAARCFQANGRMIRNAADQRRNDSVTGGIWSAASRPTIALPAQHIAVMQSSR